MSLIQHLVSPKLPTALTDDTHVDLPGYDIYLAYVNNVHVVPTTLDIPKFEDALSRVLQLYPHTAGRLRCTDRRWFIELTNSAVPVDIEYKHNTSPDTLLDGDWVVQRDLSPLLNQHPIGVNPTNSNAPLLRLKLTFFDHETCIGVTRNHSLGDGTAMSRFIHMLSQFYQGLSPKFALPSFKKHHFPTPTQSMVTELSTYILLHAVPPFDEGAFGNSLKDLEHVRWRMDDRDLEELRLTLCRDRQDKHLSKQDCLIAYVITILNHNTSSTVQRVRRVSSYRRIRASFIAESVAGNCLLCIPASVPTDMAGIASALRDALVKSREPNCIYLFASVASEYMLEAANAGRLHPCPYPADELFVNSHATIDWCSAHFGFPDATRFHTAGYFHHFLSCYRSNPAKGEDGVWRPRQSIEISLGATAALKPRITETLARGIHHMLQVDDEQGRSR